MFDTAKHTKGGKLNLLTIHAVQCCSTSFLFHGLPFWFLGNFASFVAFTVQVTYISPVLLKVLLLMISRGTFLGVNSKMQEQERLMAWFSPDSTTLECDPPMVFFSSTLKIPALRNRLVEILLHDITSHI